MRFRVRASVGEFVDDQHDSIANRPVIAPSIRGRMGKEIMREFREACEESARLGGQVLRSWQGKFQTRNKGPKDVVTEADVASQVAIFDFLRRRFPDHDFLGEEDVSSSLEGVSGRHPSTEVSRRSSAYRWIVDPLDGTANYARGLPAFAVSVALEYEGTVIAGTVYDPSLDECFTAAAGEGAYLNRERLQTSSCERLENAMVAASFAADVVRGSPEVAQFLEVLHACHSMRRLGSAALNLCYVASGRMDAYWSCTTKIWDVAAGLLLIREAGGAVGSLEGGAINLERPCFAVAATESLQQQLVALLSGIRASP